MAKILTNNPISEQFPLGRGTRQFCPLSASLFTIAIEPLAIQVHSSPSVVGFRVEIYEEHIALYAVDSLLFLQDPMVSSFVFSIYLGHTQVLQLTELKLV